METVEVKVEGKESGHKRSASYPAKNLERAIEFVGELYQNYSAGVGIKREEWAVIKKIHPNTVAREFAAATQFGLLDKTPSGYVVSQLYIDIVKPENPGQRKASVLKAFASPKLFQVLIEKFDTHLIPAELPNTLVKHHQIIESVAQEASEIFIESATFAEALNGNRILQFKHTLSSVQKTKYAEIIEEPSDDSKFSSTVPTVIAKKDNSDFSDLDSDYKRVPIHLTKNKVAYFAYPANTSEKDIKIIKHQIEGILLQIQLDNEDQEKTPHNSAGL